MAKRTTTSTTDNYSAVRLCAFWGVMLAGIVGIANLIITILDRIFENDDWKWPKTVTNILNIISTVAIFIAVWLAGWDFVKTKGRAWRIIFIVFFVIALLGLFGVNILAMFK